LFDFIQIVKITFSKVRNEAKTNFVCSGGNQVTDTPVSWANYWKFALKLGKRPNKND
jgi:hypothetical protein